MAIIRVHEPYDIPTKRFSFNQGNLASWDAETCVTLLRMPTVSNYSGLKKLMEVVSDGSMNGNRKDHEAHD